MLQLLKNGEPVQLVRPGGHFTYDDKTVFGAGAGWAQDGYSLVEYIAPPVEPSPPTVDDYRDAIQSLVDQTAQSRRYDSGNSLASYVASTNTDWAAEAAAFIAWRDAVWAYAYGEMDKVMLGEREQPSVEDFLNELPEIGWPE